MGLRLQRLLAPVERLTAGQYTTETASGAIAICCPLCGGISDVPETHAPPPCSDLLRYIWSCPSMTCPCMEFISLDSYLEDS